MNTRYWVGKYDVHGVIYPHDGPHSTQGKAEKALKMLTVMNKVDKFGIISVTTLETEAYRIDSEVDDVCEFLFGCTGAECRPDVAATIRAVVEAGFKRPEGGSLPEKETSNEVDPVEIQLDTSMYDFTGSLTGYVVSLMKGHPVLHDFITHVDDFREAILTRLGAAEDQYDAMYWDKQLETIDNLKSTVSKLDHSDDVQSHISEVDLAEIQLDMSMYDSTIQCDGGAFDMPVKTGGRMAGVYSQIVRDRKRRNAVMNMLKDVGIDVTPELVDRPNPFTLGMFRHSQVTMAKKLVDAGYIKGIN